MTGYKSKLWKENKTNVSYFLLFLAAFRHSFIFEYVLFKSLVSITMLNFFYIQTLYNSV